MKKSVAIAVASVAGLFVVLVLVLVIGLVGSSESDSLISLVRYNNGLVQGTNMVRYHITSKDRRLIIPVSLIVETNSGAGWKVASEQSLESAMLSPGSTRVDYVSVPTGVENWRLRMTYIPEMTGYQLIVNQAWVLLKKRRLPRSGVPFFGWSQESVVEGQGKRPGITGPALTPATAN